MDKDEREMAQYRVEIDLVHAVLRDHTDPLTVDEIVAAAAERGARADDVLRANVEQVLARSSLVMPLADGLYAWLPRLMTGSIIRVPLFPAQLVDGVFSVSEEFEQGLWPSRGDSAWFIDPGPVTLTLPDADPIEMDFPDEEAGPLEPWLRAQRPRFGDSLIVTMTDGPARLASIRLERRAERDKQAVAARNAELYAAADAWLTTTGDTFLYNLSLAMLTEGVLKTSPPPDPLVDVLADHPLWNEIYAKRYERDYLDEVKAKLARPEVDPDDEVPDEAWDDVDGDVYDDDDEADPDDGFDPGDPVELSMLPRTGNVWTFGLLRFNKPVRDDQGNLIPAQIVVCLDDESGHMLLTEVIPGKLEPSEGFDLLANLMVSVPPEHGGPQRPSLVQYNSAKLLDADDRQALFELGIDTRRVNLDALQKNLDVFVERPAPPGLLDDPTVTAADVGAVMAAAADFYAAAPWVPLDNEDALALKIDAEPERIVQVLGAGGVEYGLILHEHWEAYLASQHRAYDDDPERVVKPATILFFEAEPALVPADREAFKTHGWAVADTPDGKGYPMLLYGAPSPNQPARRPNVSELRDLQAAALALAQLTRERLPATGQLSGVRLDETLSLPLIGGQARVRVRFPAGVIDKGQLPSHARPTSEHMVMMEPTMWDVVSQHGGAGLPPELRKAQQLVYKARESDNPARRLALAHQALALSADCADAYVLLAEEEADTRLRARDLFAQGVAAGERALGPDFFMRERGHFWGMIATRPYMRARNGLGLVLWELGEHRAALDHFRAMLDLNPGDNQGVRYLAALLMLELWQTEALIGLIADQAEDGSAAWHYFGVLAHFRRDGDSPETRQRLAEARQANPHVIDFLLQRQRLDAEQPDSIGFGDRREAVAHAQDVLGHWRRTPGAVAWLREMAERST